ncbi:tRNA (N6-isopentenyl adenosine(37)-C2)-methylthiotransferase MiaB [Candidatus Actinomarina sp.]|nr:tRNA (N6-isopentenyl adenosine(37)-C2)-methylthiotransferase MiaB [Candidatus Actinomarina sp.]
MKAAIELNKTPRAKPSRSGLSYFVKTFGCQMNEHDSERIAGLFEYDGMLKANSLEQADVLFINTCTIRENADDKLYGTLGQLKKWKSEKSNRKLLVGGCAAQKDKELVRERAPWVDVVIGTHNLTNIVNLLNQSEDWGPITEVIDEIESLPTDAPSIRESEVSAWLTIQIGCNNSCTFCIVPSVRGPEISRRPSDIVNEATAMIDSGVKEITLLGQNVNSYGRDLKINSSSKPYFTELLTELNNVEGLKRIRFTSPHPKDFKPETLTAVNDLDKVANQIHMPLQSGSNKILRKMQRGYTQEKFLEKLNLAKETIEDVSLTTDIIVGFPGETDEDFEETLKVIKESQFDAVYMFKFSPRPGTTANTMDDDFIEKEVIDSRFMKLKEIQTEISHVRYKRFIGTDQKLLVEKYSKKTNTFMSGKIDGGQTVHIPSQDVSIGDFLYVRIIEATPFALTAEII